MSYSSPVQVLITIPFAGYNLKLSSVLSTIITFDKSLPNLLKSYFKNILKDLNKKNRYSVNNLI